MATVATEVVKFHLSLNVTDLKRAVAFYEALFGRSAAKVKADYAKFEVDDPPLIMSLIPTTLSAGGALNHIGVRLLDSATLVALQSRLEQAGYTTQGEDGVECCYSKQTKFWVTDPDKTLWELYILHGEADEHDDHPQTAAGTGRTAEVIQSLRQAPSGALPVVTLSTIERPAAAEPSVWQHILTQPLPARIEHIDQSVDRVQLQGTLNMQVAAGDLAAFLLEVRRVLKPGGEVICHNLTADRALNTPPQLPGPAALVQFVPVETDTVAALQNAGFVQVEISKLAAKPCFVVGESEPRETFLTARQPAAVDDSCCDTSRWVLYRGPLRELVDDFGNRYSRGVRVQVTSQVAEWLQGSPWSGQFTFFGTASAGGCCS